MDYTYLMKTFKGRRSRVGIIGATRGYGYTLLAQIPEGRADGAAADQFPPYG